MKNDLYVGDLVRIENEDWLDDNETIVTGLKGNYGIVKDVHEIDDSQFGYVVEPFEDSNELYTVDEDLSYVNPTDEFLVNDIVKTAYTMRVKREHKKHGPDRLKSHRYYLKNRFKNRVKHKVYRRKNKFNLERRKNRPSYHRVY